MARIDLRPLSAAIQIATFAKKVERIFNEDDLEI